MIQCLKHEPEHYTEPPSTRTLSSSFKEHPAPIHATVCQLNFLQYFYLVHI